MEFWKEHVKLRMFLIAILFVSGVAATIFGWCLTGELAGLGIMVLGVAFLLAALWIYNKPYEKTYKKKA